MFCLFPIFALVVIAVFSHWRVVINEKNKTDASPWEEITGLSGLIACFVLLFALIAFPVSYYQQLNDFQSEKFDQTVRRLFGNRLSGA